MKPKCKPLIIALIFLLFVNKGYCQKKISGNTQTSYSTLQRHGTNKVSVWLTNADKSVLFRKQKEKLFFRNAKSKNQTIVLSDKQSFQSIDGFGYCLTGGSATLINQMKAGSKAALLKELFATDGNNIGVSYLRISIGASDLDDHVFSYDDLPVGETDESLQKFTIEHERKDLIPVLKEILKIAPKIKILGSPWSPPTWMKTNDSSKGGSLKPESYNVYANYFVK